ncbi:20S proteasome A-type and B-type family protein [Babesia bovis T2Bo]|uniref:Proteasome subunit beta n=1 Tax=Babesia bovis TaxID=5865 RepID=Q2PKF6_BABBO|nr:20S proteasome A-type and B-type family protein [Babesia bovis T2Bo]ABC25612.1 putative proteasome subunit [Babesia bovis]EDO08476.1 20S proteasome A-type and B-type family protein [Babesia bovis T2Bo]BAN65742.1 proteasome A-type and B-type family protein [Babesia bovis]|eukprot:XP_001612044.1 proteasome A-type and B-type family protein [Babesia bovis T2Bo]
MSRRYDTKTTTFSQEGRLYQVEYALEAINNANLTVGLLCDLGVVLAADKPISTPLLDPGKINEKLYKLDSHMFCAVAGLTADATVLINTCKLYAQRHRYAYGEPQDVEQHVVQICNLKQSYTQFGGLRPFGVSFLFAGWDSHLGFQLYHTDPSGNYSGWKATAIGHNSQPAQSMLRQEWKEGMNLDEALYLAVKVLTKSMDSTMPKADKIEVGMLWRGPNGDGEPTVEMVSESRVAEILSKLTDEAAAKAVESGHSI